MKCIRWGIVSAGKICHDFVNAMNSYPDKSHQMVVVAVAARDINQAASFAKIHGIQKVFGSFEEMAKCPDIDVAYIGALNPFHYELSKLFLEEGKHVLCEKPMCMSVEEVKELTDLSRKKKLFLMEAIWSRFSGAYRELRQKVEEGAIGEVKHLEVNFGFNSDSDRIQKKEYGGSAVLDVGVYVLQLSQFVFKEPVRGITASINLNEYGVDYAASIILQYSGDKRAIMNIHTRLQLCNKATIYGSGGYISLEPPFHFPTVLTLPDGTKRMNNLHPSTLTYNFENSAGLVYEAMHVADCIRSGKIESDIVPHQDSIKLADLEDIIRGKSKKSTLDKNIDVMVNTLQNN